MTGVVEIMQKALVSVVVPVFNTPDELLEACVHSILSQSYGLLELIIVDDGSARPCSDGLNRIALGDARVSVYHLANQGVSAARNYGMAMASGEFITFVDADDCLADGWIELAIRVADENDADVVAGEVEIVKAVPTCRAVCPNPRITLFDSTDLWKLQISYLYAGSGMFETYGKLDIACHSKVIRARCIEGLHFPDGIKLSEDQVFNHLLLRKADVYVLVDSPSYFYIVNDDSVSHSYHADAVGVMMNAMGEIRDCIYDRDENWQAYYFRILMEACTSFQFMAFSDASALNFRDKISCLRAACHEPLLCEAIAGLRLGSIESKPWRIKGMLVKYRLFSIYILLKDITDIRQSNRISTRA